MAWTAPRTWESGDTVTAAALNTDVRDNQIRLESRIQAGTAAVTPVSGTPTSATVTFPVAFAVAPYVQVSVATSSVGTGAGQVEGVGASSVTTTNFVVTVNRNSTTVTNVRWIAMEVGT